MIKWIAIIIFALIGLLDVLLILGSAELERRRNEEARTTIIPQGWIPCSERLPARQGYYICACKDGSRVLKTTTIKWSNGWQLSGTRAYWKVIAWMPLPEPYRESEDE